MMVQASHGHVCMVIQKRGKFSKCMGTSQTSKMRSRSSICLQMVNKTEEFFPSCPAAGSCRKYKVKGPENRQ